MPPLDYQSRATEVPNTETRTGFAALLVSTLSGAASPVVLFFAPGGLIDALYDRDTSRAALRVLTPAGLLCATGLALAAWCLVRRNALPGAAVFSLMLNACALAAVALTLYLHLL